MWHLTSCQGSVPLWCDNKDFRLQKPHPLIVGNERGVVGLHANQLTSLMWLRLPIAPFSVHYLKLVGVPTSGGFYWH